jgi:LacI family transcriptional regulator
MTIGIILPDISNPYYAEIVRGIQDKSDEEGYSVLIMNTDFRNERIMRCIYDLRDKHVDGVIFAGGVIHLKRYREVMKNLASRCVVIGRCSENFPAIRIDNSNAMEAAVGYLISLGHRSIAYVNSNTASSTMIDRYKGFVRAMKNSAYTL